MRFISVLALACAGHIVAAQQPKQTTRDMSISCLVYESMSFYDMRPIQSTGADYQVQNEAKTETYSFNLCGQTKYTCTDKSVAFAYKNDTSGACTTLTDLTVMKPKVMEDSKESYVQFVFGSPESQLCINSKG